MGAVSKSFHHGLNYPQRPCGPAVYVAFRHARPRPRPCRISATTQRHKLPCRSNVKQAGDAKIFRFNSSPARHMAASCQFATQSTAQGRGASPLNMVFPRFHKRVQRLALEGPNSSAHFLSLPTQLSAPSAAPIPMPRQKICDGHHGHVPCGVQIQNSSYTLLAYFQVRLYCGLYHMLRNSRYVATKYPAYMY